MTPAEHDRELSDTMAAEAAAEAAMAMVDELSSEKDDKADSVATEILVELTLVEGQLGVLGKKKTELRRKLLEIMVDQNLGAITTPDGLGISRYTDYNVKTVAKAGKVASWLAKTGNIGIIKNEPHWAANTLKSLVKKRIENEESVPKTLFDVSEFDNLRFKAGKTKWLAKKGY